MEDKDSAAVADAMEASGDNIGLSGDVVATAMDRLVDDGAITPLDKGLVMWLFGEAKGRGLSLADTGKMIGYDQTTVSRLFRGRYEGSMQNVAKAIKRAKHLADERSQMVSAEFIETSIWRDVRATCDLALVHQMPAIIEGPSQMGKTVALREYQRRSEYAVRYVRVPSAPGIRGMMEAVADACMVTTRCTSEQLRRRVAKSLDERTLLILDEFHQLAISSGAQSARKCMEWVRELYDESKCGLVFCGTNKIMTDLFEGEVGQVADQLLERCIVQLTIPARLPDTDIALVGQAYGLPPPNGEVLDLVRTLRMNRLCKVLMLSEGLARKRGVPLSWDAFLQTYTTVVRR